MLPVLNAQECLARLRLIRTGSIGPVSFHQLLARFGSAAAALREIPEISRRAGSKRALKPYSEKQAKEEMARLESLGGRHIFLGAPEYPALLAALGDAPPVLSFLGHSFMMHKECVAVVGARNSGTNIRMLCKKICRDLAETGIIIVSGMARGIDSAAHAGALEAEKENGGTIAVLAGGIDDIYPPENKDLYQRIAQEGCLLSEWPPGTRPFARHFPQRNRIISGLCRMVLISEAAERSGSLVTARHALEQGREVGAIPGTPVDPRVRGSNRLLREGAHFIESARDILNILEDTRFSRLEESKQASMSPPPVRLDPDRIDHVRQKLEHALSAEPVHISVLCADLDEAPALIRAAITELELAGKAKWQGAWGVVRIF